MAKGLKRVVAAAVGLFLALLLLLFIVGMGVGYATAKGSMEPNAAIPVVMGVFAVLLMMGSFWIGVLWMRSIDEAAREAHKWAWYWGGTAGMSVGGVFMLLSAVPRATPMQVPLVMGPTPDPAGYAATGAFALMMLMTIGYSIAWAIWWWRHR